jgi:hypothetical protein
VEADPKVADVVPTLAAGAVPVLQVVEVVVMLRVVLAVVLEEAQKKEAAAVVVGEKVVVEAEVRTRVGVVRSQMFFSLEKKTLLAREVTVLVWMLGSQWSRSIEAWSVGTKQSQSHQVPVQHNDYHLPQLNSVLHVYLYLKACLTMR